MNGTLRELERRAEEFQTRTGRPLDAMYISHERWQLLPEPFRLASIKARLEKKTTSNAVIAGVPVYFIEIVADGFRA